MAASTRLVVLLAVMAVLAGCGSSGFDKAGGSQPRHPVVLTLAYFNASPGELDGFTSNVWRLSGGTMRIAIKYRWRYGQVKPENGLIGDVRPGKADLGVVGGRAWDSVGVDGFRALVAPLLIDSYALQDRVLRSPMIGQMLAVTDDLAAEANVVRGDERADTATLCRRGLLRLVDASPAGLAALRRAVQPVYAQLERDPQTRRYIRQIKAMRQAVPAEAAPGCAAATRPAGTAGTLDGVYRFTDTAAQLRAAPGTTAGEVGPENYGEWTLVLDRGHFATTQEDSQACTWAYGRFTIKGNKIEWLFTDGGAPTHDPATNKPGEDFLYGWSLYRGVLTLSPVKGAISPSNFRVKPWARISTTPSARFLSKHCPPPAGALPR